MGFWRGVGYAINILIILSGIAVANTTPFNIDIIIGFGLVFIGVIGIWFLRFYSLGERIDKNLQYLIDGSNRAFVNLLKIKFGESLTWDTKDVSPESMKVVPVNFGTEHKQLLSHLHVMISKGYVAIPEKHDKLITSLRTAYAKELTLNKEQTSYDDLLDSLRLSLKGYN